MPMLLEPVPDEIHSRPRRRRWPAVLPTIVVVLVLAAGGAGVALWLRRAPTGSAPSAVPSVPLLPTATLVDLPGDLALIGSTEAAFVDADHGYLLLGRCPGDQCEAWVAATRDGGRTLYGALIPGLSYPASWQNPTPRVLLVALDAEHAVLEGYDNASPFGGPQGRRWYTSDSGHTWAEVPVAPVATVSEIPDDAYATVNIAGDTLPLRVEVDLVLRDGASAVLATPPATPYSVAMAVGGLALAPDGSRWVHVGDDEHESLFRSTDRGRTWTEMPWPDGLPEKGHGYRFHGASGRTVYWIDEGAFRAWRSNDAGATWQELQVPFDNGGYDFGLQGFGQPDGSLVVVKPVVNGQDFRTEYLAITPGGSSFEPSGPPIQGAATSLGKAPGERRYSLFGPAGQIPLPFGCLGQDGCR